VSADSRQEVCVPTRGAGGSTRHHVGRNVPGAQLRHGIRHAVSRGWRAGGSGRGGGASFNSKRCCFAGMSSTATRTCLRRCTGEMCGAIALVHARSVTHVKPFATPPTPHSPPPLSPGSCGRRAGGTSQGNG